MESSNNLNEMSESSQKGSERPENLQNVALSEPNQMPTEVFHIKTSDCELTLQSSSFGVDQLIGLYLDLKQKEKQNRENKSENNYTG